MRNIAQERKAILSLLNSRWGYGDVYVDLAVTAPPEQIWSIIVYEASLSELSDSQRESTLLNLWEITKTLNSNGIPVRLVRHV